MPTTSNTIPIPNTDMWSTIFARDEKPFPDHQVLYTNPTTSRSYNFSELRQLTREFGAGLRKSVGFGKGDVLALVSNNCIDTTIVTWGTQFVGGVVSPANPAYTRRELAFHLSDCGAKIVVTIPSLLEKVREAISELEGSGKIAKDGIQVLIQGDEEIPKGEKSFKEIFCNEERYTRLETIDQENDLAYLVYSSGTTGLPKGVMLSHRNVVADLLMVASREGTMMSWDRDLILSVLPFYHIYGLQCILQVPCYTGVPTIVMENFTLPSFLSLIQKYRLTYTYVAPPIIVHLAKSPMVDEYDLKSLRSIVSGAAPLSKELIYKVKERLGVEIRQAYGLSETSPVTHIQNKWNHALGSVGPPLPNLTILIMSATHPPQPLPSSQEGEIYIAGPTIFLGYHHNPDSSSASIFFHSGQRFFKTGDVGYVDDEQNLYITDRVKELIKYKGYQVAPAELEDLLMGCEGVEDVAVVGGWDGERETEVPVGFVVGKRSGDGKGVIYGEEEGRRVEEWLSSRVADHKRLRGGVRWVDSIPKSASGKILRRVLRERLKKEVEGKKAKL